MHKVASRVSGASAVAFETEYREISQNRFNSNRHEETPIKIKAIRYGKRKFAMEDISRKKGQTA